MSVNRGKQFEERFKEDWKRTFPHSFLYRIPDQLSYYYGNSQNICDFLAFNNKKLYLLECKTHSGASIPFENIPQYKKLVDYKDYDDIISGIVLWLYDKDQVLFIPIRTLYQLDQEGKKSVGIKAMEEGYNIIKIPSVKKRVFMESDYSILSQL